MHERIEVLAPGGSVEAIRAALANGADAIYLGVGGLNARVRARNLELSQLAAVAAWIHAAGARVHVTLNLPLREADVAEAARTLIACRDAGADAVIVRDPLLMQAAREFAPGLEVHASTQFGVASVAMARAARDLGCRRVVLARELSAAEIAVIRREVPDVDLEVFVFGALCFGVSGACLLGEAVAGRSGNYGACAQTCRLPFFDEGGRPLGHVLSMKDLDLTERLPELARLGVRSVKIEGRLKPPAWVGCATRWIRRATERPDGLPPGDLEAFRRDVSAIFSRPRTDAWLAGRTGHDDLVAPEAPGHRGLDVGGFAAERVGDGIDVFFRTPVDLNIRDGLLLTVRDRASADGLARVPLAVESLADEQGRPCVRVPAGRTARVRVASGLDPVAVAIHSSDPVRVAYEGADREVPAAVVKDETPPPRFARVAVRPDAIEAEMVRGRVRETATVPVASQPARNEGLAPDRLGRLFGEADFDVAPGLFVNPSDLKAARRALWAAFEAAATARADRDAAACEAWLRGNARGWPVPDADLLRGGPAAVTRVTGLRPGTIRTSGGDTFEVEPIPTGARLWFRGKKTG